jgi:hypothetical protein
MIVSGRAWRSSPIDCTQRRGPLMMNSALMTSNTRILSQMCRTSALFDPLRQLADRLLRSDSTAAEGSEGSSGNDDAMVPIDTSRRGGLIGTSEDVFGPTVRASPLARCRVSLSGSPLVFSSCTAMLLRPRCAHIDSNAPCSTLRPHTN